MAIALVANAVLAQADGGTSSAIDTTGATLLVIHVSAYVGGGALAVSDSKGNTWSSLTATSSGETYSQIFYVANPTVGTGHTFTQSTNGKYYVLCAAAFSGVITTSPFDQQNGATAGGVTSQAPGSVTPSEDNELVITGISTGAGSSGTFSVNGGFTITNQVARVAGVNEGGAMAYLIQTTAAAANPSWSWDGATEASARIATFKAAGGASAVPLLMQMYSGS